MITKETTSAHRSAQEMASLFRDVKGAVGNTSELSSRLQLELNDLGYAFPRYPVPEGETMDSFLRKRGR
jgi:error-prone DNA polymerase